MKEIDKIAFIYLKEGQILSSKSKGKTKFYIPGGKREEGESNFDTLIREIKEELSVDIIEKTIQYFGTFVAQSDGYSNGINVKMTCYIADFIGNLKASNEIEELKWLDTNDMNIISEVDKKIFIYLKKNRLLK